MLRVVYMLLVLFCVFLMAVQEVAFILGADMRKVP
jgi:hypothetical protein